ENDNDSDNKTTDDNKSGNDNSLNKCSNDEYNKFSFDGEPHICIKEKKLHRYKYFLQLLDPKKIQCIYEKEL
ncbi:25866_t:CDS:1, partial [Gigaspora margarita]